MKTPFLILLLVLGFGVCTVPVNAQVEEGPISVSIDFTPETNYSQMVYGESYLFDVRIENIDLDFRIGEVTDPVLKFRFSGNLVAYISFTVGKEGSYQMGGESLSYVIPLEAWEDSYDIALPDEGEANTLAFSYLSNRGYDARVMLDDWVTFTIDVHVYLWEYREIEDEVRYHLGALVGETSLKFYVTSAEKIEYIVTVFDHMSAEILEARQAVLDLESELGTIVDVDLTGYEAIYWEMGSLIGDRDYVSAMELYSEYEPTWKDELISGLKGEVEELKLLEEIVANFSIQFADLGEAYQELQGEYENFTAAQVTEVAELNQQLSSARTNGRLYLFGVVVLGAAALVIYIRTMRKPTPVSIQ